MEFLQQAGLALHRLTRAPGYTAASVVSLALAIGATSAIFSVVHAVVLRPLPLREPDRLVTCWEANPRQDLAVVEVSYRELPRLAVGEPRLHGAGGDGGVALEQGAREAR